MKNVRWGFFPSSFPKRCTFVNLFAATRMQYVIQHVACNIAPVFSTSSWPKALEKEICRYNYLFTYKEHVANLCFWLAYLLISISSIASSYFCCTSLKISKIIFIWLFQVRTFIAPILLWAWRVKLLFPQMLGTHVQQTTYEKITTPSYIFPNLWYACHYQVPK